MGALAVRAVSAAAAAEVVEAEAASAAAEVAEAEAASVAEAEATGALRKPQDERKNSASRQNGEHSASEQNKNGRRDSGRPKKRAGGE
ncbi:MAG: hypothetical protein ACI9KE_004597, partial [Polyangiales bacterium]